MSYLFEDFVATGTNPLEVPGMFPDWELTFGAPGTPHGPLTAPFGCFPGHNWYGFGGNSMRKKLASGLPPDKLSFYMAFRKRADVVGRMISFEGRNTFPPPQDKTEMLSVYMERDQSLTMKCGGLTTVRYGNTGYPNASPKPLFLNNNVWYFIQVNLEIPPHLPTDPIPIIADLAIDGITLISDIKSGTLLDSQFGGAPGFNWLLLDGTGNSGLQTNDFSEILVDVKEAIPAWPFGQKLSSITISNGGLGYSSPTISFSSATGGGAAAHAIFDGTGKITKVIIDNVGKGYTTPLTLILTDPTGSGAVLVPVVVQPNERLSQYVLEVAKTVDATKIRVSQMVLEVAIKPKICYLRDSQMVIELGRGPDGTPTGSGGWRVKEA